MDRLTSHQKSALKAQLTQWQPPEDMLHIVGAVGSIPFHTQSGLEFLRDAWIGAEFGKLRQATHVRLIADTRPDFELRIDTQEEVFEAVEALDPKRRRSDEYRSGTGEAKHYSERDWIAQAEQAASWLETACRKKVGKGCDPSVNLVIYLNFTEFGIRQKEVESCFPAATALLKHSFGAVWVLWKNRAHLIWEDGRPS